MFANHCQADLQVYVWDTMLTIAIQIACRNAKKCLPCVASQQEALRLEQPGVRLHVLGTCCLQALVVLMLVLVSALLLAQVVSLDLAGGWK